MSFIFGIPASKFFTRLFTEPLTLFRTIFGYICLIFQTRKPRIELHDVDSKDLTKMNGLLNPEHSLLENAENPLGNHTSDSVLIYGENSSGSCLVVRVCREREGHLAWLHLRLGDGRTYQLNDPGRSYPPSQDFTAAGLRVKCHLPMRKWRIAFNGLLTESEDGENDSSQRTRHIKLNFIVNHNGYPFDLKSEIHPSLMSSFLGKRNHFPLIPNIERVTQFLENYVQPCNILGTVTVDGEEQPEVYLWGFKKRSKDSLIARPKSSLASHEFFGYSKDGQNVYAGMFDIPGSTARLSVGQYRERNGIVWPVRYCEQDISGSGSSFQGMTIQVITDRSRIKVNVSRPKQTISWISGMTLSHLTFVHMADFKLHDEDAGHAIVIENTGTRFEPKFLNRLEWRLPLLAKKEIEENDLAVTLDDPKCQAVALAGGKGASLASLSYLASKYQTIFVVPWGFVVTTKAYLEFLAKSSAVNSVGECERISGSSSTAELTNASNQALSDMSNSSLPGTIQEAIRQILVDKFSDDFVQKRYAVRSSASGEDSEEMSAAGQMSTFLGVQGLDNIFEAVVRCWASQFSFTAIQYKRQNGQELNSAMAVVVQEMVPAHTAGVLFTCDPVTGDPRNVTITANYGIGESVVSASAEPDTLVLERDAHNQVTLKNVAIGRKKTKIVMADGGDVMETLNDDNSTSVCSLSPENATLLANNSLKVEEAYGFPVDIEWAFKDEQLYLLQARPVTTFYRETNFELRHSADTPVRMENEYFTKANIGEVMPGFSSHMTCSAIDTCVSMAMQQIFGKRNRYMFPYQLYNSFCAISQNQSFFSMPDVILRFYDQKKKFLSEANMIASFGRILEDPAMYEQAEKRNSNYPGVFAPKQMMYFLGDLLLGERRLARTMKKMWDTQIDLSQCKNAKEMLFSLLEQMFTLSKGTVCHLVCTSNSAIYNNIISAILKSQNKEWNTAMFHDFAIILASCGELESANIPHSIENLTLEIGRTMDINNFKEMDPKEALNWLETTSTTAGDQYREFLRRHGHRCYNEFDMYTKTWSMDKLPMIKTLQDSVGKSNGPVKMEVPISDIISNLQVPLSRTSRFLLRRFIPMCQRAVYNREKSKSLIIKFVDICRKAFWELADQLVKEGRLPDRDLLFFLTHLEVQQLVDTRSPSLIQSAIRRKQLAPELNKLRYPEISTGIPRPVNLDKAREDFNFSSDLELFGTPVSQGVAKGFARVAMDLEEAAQIQPGEILIAYSTDIAWSPYFPLLSGVVTELGGLISHGAVVAREYGLPCIVAAIDATLKFKTGDYVLLDGSKGFLKRIEET